jgi:alkylhydroperoxidase/carboxymuconolactone decarboxylase family protein YurZ
MSSARTVGATVIAAKEASMSTPQGDTPLLDLLGEMTNASIERSTLDPKTLMLVRIAALASVDAPPVSYLMNLGAGAEVGVEAEDVQQVLIGIAPVVGAARVASAAGKMARALGFAIAVAEAEIEEEAAQAEG